MTITDINALIPSKIRLHILKILSLDPDSTYNINELSRITGFSPRGVEKELKNLLAGGVLKRDVLGNQHRYQLDSTCPIHHNIRQLLVKTVGVGDVIKRALKAFESEIELAFIFGTFATGDYGNDSAVDLFLVLEVAGIKLAELLSDLQRELGRPINISQFSPAEFEQKKEQKDPFLTLILEGPRINIIG